MGRVGRVRLEGLINKPVATSSSPVQRGRYRQPSALSTLRYGPYFPLQSGVKLGSMLLLRQFSLERCDLLLGFREFGRRAADLRDQRVKSSAVHCGPHSQSPSGDSRSLHSRKSILVDNGRPRLGDTALRPRLSPDG